MPRLGRTRRYSLLVRSGRAACGTGRGPIVRPEARRATDKTDRNAMQRLLTATAAAALVVIATVFNSLRYPAVSVQLWQASQAAHGPAIASTAPGDAAAGRSPSGESRPFGPADNDGSNIAEQKPATSPAAASSTSSPASAAAATPDRMGDFNGNVRAAGDAKPPLPADSRFSAEAPGLSHSGQQSSSERAVWPTWRSESPALPRADTAPTARPADLVPIAAPAPGDHPLPDAKPNRAADPTPVAKPPAEPASNGVAVWSPTPSSSAPSRRSLETLEARSLSSAGRSLSAAMPPPAPIPDSHRPDLVPVAPAEPVGSVAESQAAKSLQPLRRLPPVDEGTTARTKPPTAAELPAYPSTRTP